MSVRPPRRVISAVRERYDVERDDNLQLRDFPTLNHVASWVRDRAGLGAAPAAPVAPVTVAESAPTTDEVLDVVTGIVAEMTGYPLGGA